jgi:hypothetical protein
MKNSSTQFLDQMQCPQLGQLTFLYPSVDICLCLMCMLVCLWCDVHCTSFAPSIQRGGGVHFPRHSKLAMKYYIRALQSSLLGVVFPY